MQLITVATPATLPQARALAASAAAHQPDWPLEIVLVAGERALAQARDAAGSTNVRSAAEALGIDAERLISRHREPELRALLVAPLLALYARNGGRVLHLPPSAWVVGELAPLQTELADSGGVLLARRLRGELPQDGLQPSVEELERAGRISETLVGVVGGPAASEFLEWWSDRTELVLGSLDGRRVGARPEDRPWLCRYRELATARFSTALLADPGANLSMWNLHEHELGERGGVPVVDAGGALRLLDLAGFEPDRPHRLSAAASRVRVSRMPVLRELLIRYAAELQGAGWTDADRRRDVGRRLPGGLVYDEGMRSLYARALALGEGFGDVFEEPGSAAFLAWLEGPAPEGGAHGITRYLFYRVASERPDVMRAYPDLDGGDGAEYVRWCWAFGREELSIPERFLPAAGGGERRAARPEREPAPGAAAARPPRTLSRPPELAVRVTGFLGHTLGLGAAARGYVHALRAAEIPVSTVSVPLEHLSVEVALAADYGRHTFEDALHCGAHGFDIVAVNADELPEFVERLGDGYFEGLRIGIWGWETNSIPARWQGAFGLVDEIWVYSRFMAENIGAVAPVPVLALPPPVEAPPVAATPQRLGVGDGYLFLFVFDYMSTVQRKNPVGLIEAFREAFAPGEGPRLLIKTINAPLRPLADEQVLWAAHGREDIHVIDRSLGAVELQGLMAGCDCYVSLHRAEGFGLTMAEAMAIGKPVIATGYSGNVDFMDERNSFLVRYEIGRVGPECEIYPPEGEWAEPDVGHAAQLMRFVYENPREARERARRAAEDIARRLSPRATGAAMRARLQELAARAPGASTSIH